MKQRLNTIYRGWQAIAERLRRPGALVGLVALLSIGLFEPLACIVHCEVWALLSSPSAPAAHQHHHHDTLVTSQNAQANSLVAVQTLPVSYNCAQLHQDSSTSATSCQPAAPEPFHEMALLMVALLLAPAAQTWLRTAATGPPPDLGVPPGLRPPILCVYP